MKHVRIFFIAIVFIAFGCKESSKPETSNNLNEFQSALSALPDSISSLRKGLEIFKNDFDKSDQAVNDAALEIFLSFKDSLSQKVNEVFFARPDYEALTTVVWEDSARHEPGAEAYVENIKRAGFTFGSAEGMLFLVADTEIIEQYFKAYLTPATKQFFDQFAMEVNRPYTEDGGIIIPLNEVADRLAFWDSFIQKNPGSIFVGKAEAKKDEYLYNLLIGQNNTPAFEYETEKFSPDFKAAHQYYISKYSETSSANVLGDYLELIEQNGSKQTEAVRAFSEKYNPYREM